MLIAVVSSKGSPGATTTSLALTLAWPRPALLAELDPRGGDILWGYGRGQNVGGAGLLRLQLTSRTRSAAESVWSEVIELPAHALVKGPGVDGRRWWLPGLTEPRQVGTVEWDLVVRMLRAVDDVADVVADCGLVYGNPGADAEGGLGRCGPGGVDGPPDAGWGACRPERCCDPA